MANISWGDGLHAIFTKLRGVGYVPFTNQTPEKFDDSTIQYTRYCELEKASSPKRSIKKHNTTGTKP